MNTNRKSLKRLSFVEKNFQGNKLQDWAERVFMKIIKDLPGPNAPVNYLFAVTIEDSTTPSSNNEVPNLGQGDGRLLTFQFDIKIHFDDAGMMTTERIKKQIRNHFRKTPMCTADLLEMSDEE